ncbi:MAG: carbohydrate-binding family 9-like protein [Armatimonadetes bacterium]|nr:carbohydrate-binding family 9-like protein [Armatimonadota bacterium]
MRPTHRLTVLTLLLILTATAAAHAAVRVVRALPAPATLPASLAEATMTDFIDSADKPAAVQTRATAFISRDSLSFVIECLEPKMADLVAKCSKHDDGAIFADDCVEVFVSPRGSATEYPHFVTNAAGAQWDEKGKGDRKWDTAWTSRATRGADRWTVTITIPLAALGGAPKRGDVWWLNLCRQRQPAGLQLSAWSPNGSNFHDFSRFGAMVFDDACVGYLAKRYLQPFDRQAAQLRERAEIRASARRRLEATVSPAEASLQPLRDAVVAGKPVPEATFGELLATGQEALAQLAVAEGDLNETIAGAEAARRMAKLAAPGQEVLAYSTVAVTDRKVLPAPEPPERLTRELSLRACRGEYEPASFVVYPLRRTVRLEARLSDLRGPGVIPAAAVDLRAVKVWYQSGGLGRFPINEGKHLLTPELLLKDDDLVRIDEAAKANYVKLRFPDGREVWRCVSNPKPTPEEKEVSATAMPVRDAAALQPVTIRRRTAKQFWLTVHVPADARSGTYRGQVELLSEGKTVETLPLKVEVLPFDLAPNPLESSIYFHWGVELDMTGPGTLGIRVRTPEQFKAELVNLREHGIDNPTVGVYPAKGQFPEELRLRQEAGMRHDRLYYLTAYTSQLTPEQIKEIIETAKGFGYSEFYFYGNDEAQGDKLTAQRAAFEKVHAAGGKVFVAGSAGQNFPLVGDLQDLLVCYGDPTREEAANWHSKGHKIFCYANPQGGIEAPETYRRNFGLLLAVNNYDGGMTYIYYSGIPSWNDWAIGHYRQHNFVYPTADGVIDTVQWEGYREGIDDLRYLGTLRQAIADTKNSRDAKGAQAFLDTLDVTGDLYAVRDEMIRWIVRLR